MIEKFTVAATAVGMAAGTAGGRNFVAVFFAAAENYRRCGQTNLIDSGKIRCETGETR